MECTEKPDRTISNSSVMVLAETIPIDIKPRERVVVFDKETTKTKARKIAFKIEHGY